MEMTDMRTGGGQCGAVRYETDGEPLALYVCHCLECRKQSASAFGLSLTVPRARFRLTGGEPQFWTRATASGGGSRGAFCGNCGSRLWHQSAGESETLNIKAGSLDTPIDLNDAIHIWTARKLPGVVIPESAERHAGEPP